MSSFIVSDNNTDYASIDIASYDGDMVELYTPGTTPPSSTSGSARSGPGSTFVTAPDAFTNYNNPRASLGSDAEYTFITAFDQSMSQHSFDSMDQGLLAQTHAPNDNETSAPAHEYYDVPLLDAGSNSVLYPDPLEQSNGPNTMDPSNASIQAMMERMENSVGAILVGLNNLNASDVYIASQQSSGHHAVRTPRPRAAKMKPLTRQIRNDLKKLLGEDFMEDVVPREALKAFAELWASQADVTLQPACCDIEDFRINLLGSPRSAWNQSASRVFSAHFIQTHSTPPNEQHLVQYFFYQRIKGLQAAYRKESANAAARKAAVTSRRRHQRRQSLFTKRMDIAKQHPLLMEHIPILCKLGVSGMSSDESDAEDNTSGQVTRYLVHKPVWRAESLSAWLRVFDSLHVLSRKLSATRTRGSFPRLRVESEVQSTRGFVPGLPVTAYDSKWLENHIAASFNVRQTPEDYSFTHQNQIFSYLRYRRM